MCYLPGTNLPAPGARRGASEQPARTLAASERAAGAPAALREPGLAGPAAAQRPGEVRPPDGSAPPADAFAV